MLKRNKKNRRQFLKNSSLSLLSLTAIPTILKANSKKSINFKNTCNPTTEDAYGQGPFYTPNAPNIINGQLAAVNEIGTRMIISGQVLNLDCSEVIPNTEIDIWHADNEGMYDNVGFNLRGVTSTNSQGFYIFETIKPGFYLNGSTYRPSHIHIKISPPGFNSLITQLYFQGDPYIPTDGAASISNGSLDATHRIIPLVLNSNGDLEGTWDIVVDGDGVVLGSSYLHLDKGIIYNTFPNPFTNELEINYGVFNKSKVAISVFNITGEKVASLKDEILNSGKYSVSWIPQQNLPIGYYFIAIIINDLQVHYLKVQKQ